MRLIEISLHKLAITMAIMITITTLTPTHCHTRAHALCMCRYVQAYICIYMYIYINMYTHASAHTHSHMQFSIGSGYYITRSHEHFHWMLFCSQLRLFSYDTECFTQPPSAALMVRSSILQRSTGAREILKHCSLVYRLMSIGKGIQQPFRLSCMCMCTFVFLV